jgi:hypothetical protein
MGQMDSAVSAIFGRRSHGFVRPGPGAAHCVASIAGPHWRDPRKAPSSRSRAEIGEGQCPGASPVGWLFIGRRLVDATE